MNAAEINILLCNRADQVVKHLLPGCEVKGRDARIGDIAGSPGKSLKVCISGSNIGKWSDFSDSIYRGNTLISLWCEVRMGDFKLAMKEAQAWLGISNKYGDSFYTIKTRPRPVSVKTKGIAAKLDDSVIAYLTGKRGIKPETVLKFKVGRNAEGTALHFPFFDATGEILQMGKFLIPATATAERDIWSEGSSKVLFGKQTVEAKGGELYITEGEMDAMSMHDMGYPAVSVPFGAKCDAKDGTNPNEEWIELDYEWLECFSRIYLCFDRDDKGESAAKSIVKRLGLERTYLVEMPEGCKDANDVLLKGKQADLFEAINGATTADPAELKNAESFREIVWKRFNPTAENAKGIPFMFDVPWRIRRKELTIWTGISGHGKSEVLNHLAVHLGDLGEKTLIASFEVMADKTLENLARQAGGRSVFGGSSREDFDAVFSWLCDRIWIVDRVGRFSWKDLIVIFKYARRRYGITQFIVDSLLRCGIAGDDYEGQKSFTDALVLFAMDDDCHVHLVAHSRKLENEGAAPGKQDVKGSGDITDLAHNVASVFRNKAKEKEIEDLKIDGKAPGLDLLQKPDGFLQLTKQRETGEEFRARFWFLGGVKQFTDKHTTPAKRYAPRIQ